MVINDPGLFGWSPWMVYTWLKGRMCNYIYWTNNHSGMLSKTQNLRLGLNYIQHSNTPVIQYSGIMMADHL
jgi:hypothetical protein